MRRDSKSEFKEEKKEETNGLGDDEDGIPGIVSCVSEPELPSTSVKDRISVYGGSRKPSLSSKPPKSWTVDRQYAAQFAARVHPPKIDIYSNERNNLSLQGRQPSDEVSENLEQQQQQPYATTAAPRAVLQGPETANSSATTANNNMMHSSPMRTASASSKSAEAPRSTGKAMVSAFLSGIHSSPNAAATKPLSTSRSTTPVRTRRPSVVPVAEVSTEDPSPGMDALSVSLSSVSGEDFAVPRTKRGLWQERNRVSAYSTALKQAGSPPTNGNNTEAMIERMVDERVQAQLSVMQSNMEDQMKRFMQEMESRMNVRLSSLEGKMQSMIRTLQQQDK